MGESIIIISMKEHKKLLNSSVVLFDSIFAFVHLSNDTMIISLVQVGNWIRETTQLTQQQLKNSIFDQLKGPLIGREINQRRTSTRDYNGSEKDWIARKTMMLSIKYLHQKFPRKMHFSSWRTPSRTIYIFQHKLCHFNREQNTNRREREQRIFRKRGKSENSSRIRTQAQISRHREHRDGEENCTFSTGWHACSPSFPPFPWNLPLSLANTHTQTSLDTASSGWWMRKMFFHLRKFRLSRDARYKNVVHSVIFGYSPCCCVTLKWLFLAVHFSI